MTAIFLLTRRTILEWLSGSSKPARWEGGRKKGENERGEEGGDVLSYEWEAVIAASDSVHMRVLSFCQCSGPMFWPKIWHSPGCLSEEPTVAKFARWPGICSTSLMTQTMCLLSLSAIPCAQLMLVNGSTTFYMCTFFKFFLYP